MKKILIIALLGSACFTACKKDQPQVQENFKAKKTATDPYKDKPIKPGDGQHYGSHSNASGVDCPGPNTCNPPK